MITWPACWPRWQTTCTESGMRLLVLAGALSTVCFGATFHVTLLDAGCEDRSLANLRTPPETLAQALPAAASKQLNSGSVSTRGISVDAKTVQTERDGVLEHLVPDMVSRMSDPTCAVTGGTRSFAALLDDGRLLNLDEGGTTLALEAVESSVQGRAMLNGTGPSLKPRATINGMILHNRIIVHQITLEP